MDAKRKKLRVETVKKKYKGKEYTSVLLRSSFRKDGKVKHQTLGNLSDLPPDVIEYIKRRLAGELDENAPHSSFEIVRSLPHGNVMAVLQTARMLGLENLIASRQCRERDLVMALVVARILSPRSKLSTNAALREETAKHTLAEELQLGEVDVHQLYAAMDWLAERQTRIENKLAKKHLQDGQLVLFDVSSSYYTGRESPLIQRGYSRDHRKDRPQIVYGLLCDSDGRADRHRGLLRQHGRSANIHADRGSRAKAFRYQSHRVCRRSRHDYDGSNQRRPTRHQGA